MFLGKGVVTMTEDEKAALAWTLLFVAFIVYGFIGPT